MLNSLFYRRLYEWYETDHRVLPWRDTTDAYSIWLSEIILQQTRVAQGMEYYMRFIARWPKVEDLAGADEAEVLREWQGLGYYSRARNLHKAAQTVVANGWAPFPTRFEDIRSLPGIGDYTAGAISSFAYNAPYPAMDGNVYRVVARLLDIDEAFDTTAGKKLFHKEIEALMDKENARLFNSAIMEFGALYCVPNLGDNCLSCPLQDYCKGFVHGTAALLPVRKPRPKVRDRWFVYHIYITNRDHSADRTENTDLYTLIQRRENPKDIWYHLYEFPCEERIEGLPVTGNGFRDKDERVSGLAASFTHVLSHQKIHAQFFVHRVDELPDIERTIAIPWEALDEYALSRLTLRALDTIRHKA